MPLNEPLTQNQRTFMQRVYRGGYSVVKTKLPRGQEKTVYAGKELDVVVCSEGRYESEFRAFDPMTTYPALFREFANVDYRSAEAAVSFVRQYGFLREDDYQICGFRWISNKHSWFEPVVETQVAIYDMRRHISLMEAIHRQDPYELAVEIHGESWFIPEGYGFEHAGHLVRKEELMFSGEPTQTSAELGQILQETGCPLPPLSFLSSESNALFALHVGYELEAAVGAFVDVSFPTSPALSFRPRHLLGAMYLQLALEFTGEKAHRKCEVCERWFEIGTGDNANKATRLYCSDGCRMKAYRRRKKAGENRLQISVDEESPEVDSAF